MVKYQQFLTVTSETFYYHRKHMELPQVKTGKKKSVATTSQHQSIPLQ